MLHLINCKLSYNTDHLLFWQGKYTTMINVLLKKGKLNPDVKNMYVPTVHFWIKQNATSPRSKPQRVYHHVSIAPWTWRRTGPQTMWVNICGLVITRSFPEQKGHSSRMSSCSTGLYGPWVPCEIIKNVSSCVTAIIIQEMEKSTETQRTWRKLKLRMKSGFLLETNGVPHPHFYNKWLE